MDTVQFCEKCRNKGVRTYDSYDADDNGEYICPKCGNKMINTSMSEDDFCNIFWALDYTYDDDLIEAMIALKEKDPIEYQLKMAQFRNQAEQQKAVEEQANVPHCPTCNSTDVEKISLGKKAVGGVMFGLFSSNVRKTMRCKNCGYKW